MENTNMNIPTMAVGDLVETLSTLYGNVIRNNGFLQQIPTVFLWGAPGVGKTFTAERLAYTLMGVVDNHRVEMVQFHQNYSYEDFILGYKPNVNGGFELKHGVFYKFFWAADTVVEITRALDMNVLRHAKALVFRAECNRSVSFKHLA